MAALVDITYGVGVGFGQGRRQVAEQGLAMVIRPLKQPWRIYGKRWENINDCVWLAIIFLFAQILRGTMLLEGVKFPFTPAPNRI